MRVPPQVLAAIAVVVVLLPPHAGSVPNAGPPSAPFPHSAPAFPLRDGSGPNTNAPAPVREPAPVPGASLGRVDQTLVLANGTLVNGSVTTQNCVTPFVGALDPSTGDIAVVCQSVKEPNGSANGEVALWDPTTRKVVAQLNDPDLPQLVVYDPDASSFVVLNNAAHDIWVLDARTLARTANESIPGTSFAEVYDPGVHRLFVSEGTANHLIELNLSTGAVTATIGTGSDPTFLAYDPATHEVYSSNFVSGNLTAVADSTATVAGNVPVGPQPADLILDPVHGVLYVSHPSITNVTLVNATTLAPLGAINATANLRLGAYSSVGPSVLFSNTVNSRIVILNVTRGSESANLAAPPAVTGLIDDPATGEVYAFGEKPDGAVAGIDPANGTIVSVAVFGEFPLVAAVDSRDGEYFVTNGDYTGGVDENTSVVDEQNRSVLGSIDSGHYPTRLDTDPGRGLVFISNLGSNTVSIVNGSDRQVVATIAVGAGPAGVYYDNGSRLLYVSNSQSANVSVIDTVADRVVATIPTGMGPERAVPTDGRLYFDNSLSDNVTVVNALTWGKVASIPVGLGPEPGLLDPVTGDVWVPEFTSGDIRVISPVSESVVQTIPLTRYTGDLTYDPLAATIYCANLVGDNLTVLSAATGRILGSLYAGGIEPIQPAFDRRANDLVVPDTLSGVLAFIALPPPPTYRVAFSERGLPAGSTWSVTLNGSTNSSTTAAIGFDEENGSGYRFSIATAPGFNATPGAGPLVVNGATVTVPIQFVSTAVALYPVNFSDSGLPVGSPWAVDINNITVRANGSPIEFLLPNGTGDRYTVLPVPDYVATPSNGSFDVAGTSVNVSVTFAPATLGPTIAAFRATPADPTVGATLRIQVIVTGGAVPLTFRFDGLPTGCPPVDAANLTCVPSHAGNFTVELSVTDAIGRAAGGNLTISVLKVLPATANSTATPSVLGLDPRTAALLVGVLVAAIVALGAAALLIRRRRTSGPPAAGGRR